MDEIATLIEQHPGFSAVWVFVFGAIIGSFLNVVVYRLPRGLSLNYPPSRCPKCEHGIRWYHNVPIIGWLMLRGKCYDCGNKISPRYPLVELLTGLMFVGLAYVDVYVPWMTGKIVADRAANEQSLGLVLAAYATHLFVSSCLLAAVFMRFDGQRVPAILAVPSIVIALVTVSFAWNLATARTLVQAFLVGCLAVLGRRPASVVYMRADETDLAPRRKDAKDENAGETKEVSRKGAKDAK